MYSRAFSKFTTYCYYNVVLLMLIVDVDKLALYTCSKVVLCIDLDCVDGKYAFIIKKQKNTKKNSERSCMSGKYVRM